MTHRPLTVNEVADLAGRSRSTVRRWIAVGVGGVRLTAHDAGGQFVIWSEDLARFLEETGAADPPPDAPAAEELSLSGGPDAFRRAVLRSLPGGRADNAALLDLKERTGVPREVLRTFLNGQTYPRAEALAGVLAAAGVSLARR